MSKYEERLAELRKKHGTTSNTQRAESASVSYEEKLAQLRSRYGGTSNTERMTGKTEEDKEEEEEKVETTVDLPTPVKKKALIQSITAADEEEKEFTVTPSPSSFTMEGTGTGTGVRGYFVDIGNADPTALVEGRQTSVGAKVEHQMASKSAKEAETTLSELREAQKAANMAANPAAGEAIAKSAGYESLADLNKAVSGAEEALTNANYTVDSAAQNYYDLAGREAVHDMLTSDDPDAFLKAVEYGLAADTVMQDYRYGGWDNEATEMLTSAQDQKNFLLDLLERNGHDRETANRALDYLVAQQQAKTATEEAQTTQQWADENPWLGALLSAGTSPAQGLDYISALTGNIGHNSTKDLESYVPLNASDFTITGQTQALREGATADMGNVGKFLANVGLSMVDSALLVSTLGPGATVVMGMGAASNTAKEVMDRGGTNNQALLAGLAAGVAEAAFEKFSVESLVQMGSAKNAKTFFANLLKQAGVEASEEINTELANILMDAAIMGQNSNYNVAVQQYMAQYMAEGASRDEAETKAKRQAFLDNLVQVGLAGLGGLLSGGGMAAVKMGGMNLVDAIANRTTDTEGAQLLQNALALKENGINETDTAPTQGEQHINEQDTTPTQGEQHINEPARLTNSQVEKMIRDSEEMERLGIDTNGKTMSQLRNEVRAVLAGQNQGAQETLEQGSVVTPVQETARTANPAASEAETRSRMAQGEAASAVLGENGAKAFKATYNEDVASQVDASTAYSAFTKVYNSALTGAKLTEADRAETASVPQSLIVAAESSARQDRLRAQQATYFGENAGLVKDSGYKKMHLSTKTTATLDAVAKVAGVQVKFVEKVTDGAANASYNNGVIEIAMDATDPVMTAFTHEIVHRIRETSPQSYNAMAEFVQSYLSSDTSSALARLYRKRYGTTDVSYFTEEMVADAFGTILRDGKAMEQFAQDDRTAFQKLLDAIRDMVNAVKRALSGQNVQLNRDQRQAFRELELRLSDMEQTMVKALESLPQNSEKNTANKGGEVKMSLKRDQNGAYASIDVDQEVFDGMTTEQMQAEAKRQILSRFRGKVIGSGYTVYVTKKGAEHYAHPANRRMDVGQKQDKMRASTELDTLMEASIFRENVPDDGRHPEATGGLDKLDTRFEVNGRMYEAETTVLVTDRGRVFYDVTKFKDITKREVGQTQNRAAETFSNASDNIVAQPLDSVNPDVEDKAEKSEPVSAMDGVKLSLKWDSKYMDAAENANKGKVRKEIMTSAREARRAVADIFNDPDLADSLGLPPDIIGNTYIPNSSYSGTEENTTVCIRSIAADDLMDAVAEYLGRPLTVEDTVAISQEYWKYTDRPECLYCYVAMDRKAHREFLGSYLKQRDTVLEDIHNGMSMDEAYEKFLNGRKDTKPMRNRFDLWIRNDGKAMISPNDLASYANMENAIERNGALRAQINDALMYAQSASWAKKRLSYAAYNNHILRWAQSRIDNLNSNYGLRMYSFSDFSPAFILENMQMITDASVRGLKVLAYTKELDFVRIFAGTGANINISVFGYDDGNGGVAMDAMQGADWAHAKALRGEYSNVGITFVATNDSQVEWALEQDWIDVVIPFHLVRTGKRVASYFGWKDYTAMSSDTKKKGWTSENAKSILPSQHQNDKATYLAACEANNLEPRFAEWVDHPSYMKLVNETRQSDGATIPVQPIFDVDAARESIDTMRKQGGYYTPIGGSSENMRDIAEEIAQSISGERASLKYQEGDFKEAAAASKQAIKDAQLAGMMNQGRKDAEKLRKAKEQTAAVRQQRDETIRKLKEHQREMKQKASESRHASDYRRRIERHVADLSRKLRNPTDKKHIPEAMRAPVAKLLESINLESRDGAPTKRTQAFNELKKVYAELAENLVIDPDLLGGEGTTGLLDDVISMADKRISEMNTAELETVWKALRAIEASITSANKAFSAGRFQTISEAAEALRSDNIYKRSKTEWNHIEKLQKLVSVDMLTPEAFFHRLGGAGDAIFRMMRNAQDKHIRLMEQVSQFTRENLGDVDVRKLEKEMHTVTLGGQDVEMSTAQLMELYALMRREQAMEHLQGGILPEVVAKRGLKKAARPAPARGVSLEEMVEAVGVLTDEQVQIAELLQEYASTTLSDFGNEASMEVYGYRKFNEENYWPIRSRDVKRDVQKDTQTTSIAGRGFTKNVKPHANNAVMVGSIFDTFAAHSSDMATYAAWLGTSEDVNRIRNFEFRIDGKTTGTVTDILDSVHGVNKGEQYLQKLLADIANGVKGTHAESSLTGAFVGNYKAASVGANLRVIIQQPTAILRAFDMIDPKYFVSGTNPVKGFDRAKKYSPIAVWKDWGYFDIHTGRQMKDVLFDSGTALDKVKEASMWGAGKMDSLAWGTLWNAIEQETKAKTDLNPGTEGFYQKVAERFNEIIDRTQVVDGILQRSQIMRNPDALVKMATSFMGEPTKQYNMLLSAAYDAKNGKPGGKRAFVRTGISLVVAGVVNAAAQSLMDALRDDDREKDYWEKWLNAFAGIGEDGFLSSNLADTINPMTYIPYVKDIWSVIQGYDVTRMDMDSVDKTISAASSLMKALRGEGKQTVFGASVSMIAELSRMVGIPAANLKREIMSFALTAAIETDSYLMEYHLRKAFYKVSENTTMYYDILYSAYQSDREAYEFIYADMVKSGLAEDKIKTGMETRMKKSQGVSSVADLEQRFLSPDQEQVYAKYYSSLESSSLWKKASAEQRSAVEDDLYQLVASTSDGIKMQEKLEDGARYGVSETDYLLYLLALSMADKPTDSGKYGTYTNDEVQKAIDMLNLSDKESAWLWEAQGKNENSNPYK